ncbi:MAG: TlpA family protein disulfide reductase [Chryseobacterium sp.]|nr:TlpA family protein disulfide reductase [Chryseobacterium sp.]
MKCKSLFFLALLLAYQSYFTQTLDKRDPLLSKLSGKKFSIENLKDENSKNFSFENLNGKPVMVNIWFTKCQPCIQELPYLNKLKEKWNSQITFIAITFDNEEDIRKFLINHKFNYLHLNTNYENLERFGIYKYPLNFILDKNGNIKKIYGGIDEDSSANVEKDFEKLL